jgi:DnaJ family protein C protein 2
MYNSIEDARPGAIANLETPEHLTRDWLEGRIFGAEKKVCKNFHRGTQRPPHTTWYHHQYRYTMAAAQVVDISLPTLPQGWAGEKDFKIVGALSGATKRTVEPVGPHFLAHARRVSSKTHSFFCCIEINDHLVSSQPYFL